MMKQFHSSKQLLKLSSLVDELYDFYPETCAERVRRITCQGWRIRVGGYRVIYEIDDKQRIVTILVIGHRRDVYR